MVCCGGGGAFLGLVWRQCLLDLWFWEFEGGFFGAILGGGGPWFETFLRSAFFADGHQTSLVLRGGSVLPEGLRAVRRERATTAAPPITRHRPRLWRRRTTA